MNNNKKLAMILASTMALSNLSMTVSADEGSTPKWWELVADTVVEAGKDVSTTDLETAASDLAESLGKIDTENTNFSDLIENATTTGDILSDNSSNLLDQLGTTADSLLGDVSLDEVGTLLEDAVTGLQASGVTGEEVIEALQDFADKDSLSDVNEALGSLLESTTTNDAIENLDSLLESLGIEADTTGDTISDDIVDALKGTTVGDALVAAKDDVKDIYGSAQNLTETELEDILTDLTKYATTEGLATVTDLLDVATSLSEMVAEDGLTDYLEAITTVLGTFNEDNTVTEGETPTPTLSLTDIADLLLTLTEDLAEVADEEVVAHAESTLSGSFATLVTGFGNVVESNTTFLSNLGINTESVKNFLDEVVSSLKTESDNGGQSGGPGGNPGGNPGGDTVTPEVEGETVVTTTTSSTSSSSGTKYSFERHDNGCTTITITYTSGVVKKITTMPNGAVITQVIQDGISYVSVTGIKGETTLFVPFDSAPAKNTEVYEVINAETLVEMNQAVTIQEDSLDIVVDYNITMQIHNAFE